MLLVDQIKVVFVFFLLLSENNSIVYFFDFAEEIRCCLNFSPNKVFIVFFFFAVNQVPFPIFLRVWNLAQKCFIFYDKSWNLLLDLTKERFVPHNLLPVLIYWHLFFPLKQTMHIALMFLLCNLSNVAAWSTYFCLCFCLRKSLTNSPGFLAWFKLLVLGMALKPHSNVIKRLKIKFSRFWELSPVFGEVSAEKMLGGEVFSNHLAPPIVNWIKAKMSLLTISSI